MVIYMNFDSKTETEIKINDSRFSQNYYILYLYICSVSS